MNERPPETAKRIILDVDTHGDPRIWALAEDYLRLRKEVGKAMRAMPAVSATAEAFEILSAAHSSLGPIRRRKR